MGKGGQRAGEPRPLYTWDEVREHATKDNDRWFVIDGEVYDITRWAGKHPGGSRVITHYAGQDATEAFNAFHNDPKFARKYMKALHIGSLRPQEAADPDIKKDMANLRETAENMGLFRPSITFFSVMIGHILMFEVFAYLTLWYFGTGWLPWLVSILCYSIVQGQASWTQHDYGHLSVFQNTKLNHIMHLFLMNQVKGACSDWWNHLHYQHHAKPNVMGKDPDVRMDAIFVVGDKMPEQIAKEKKSSMPYNWQHRYFFLIGPPLLFPVYFQIMMFRHAITRRKWIDLAWMMAFYVKMLVLYWPLLGLWGAIKYYFIVRCVESHWFVWVSQSNHIPMEIDKDHARPWLSLQLHATCNVEKSVFNDWFTGHLNFQIEHHLFPTMPRHNLYKIAPLVKSLCKKHGIDYQVKTLYTAFADIVRSLKHSGELWEHYYEAYHLA